MSLPAEASPLDAIGASFGERYSPDRRAEPVFMRPETQQILASLPPWAAISEGASLTEPMVAQAYDPRQIPFAAPRGPTKALKELLTAPKTLLIPKAEAEPAVPPPSQNQEALPLQGQPAEADGPSQTAHGAPPAPVRNAEPLAERPSPETAARAVVGQDRPAEPQQPPTVGQMAARPAENRETAVPHETAQEPRSTAAVDARRRIQTGRATWYQHSGRTASGEKFDPDQLTAAHHTLPFGTLVRVVNEKSGRSVEVRINDRIPRRAKIIIDLSRASAKAVGLKDVGRVSLYAP